MGLWLSDLCSTHSTIKMSQKKNKNNNNGIYNGSIWSVLFTITVTSPLSISFKCCYSKKSSSLRIAILSQHALYNYNTHYFYIICVLHVHLLKAIYKSLAAMIVYLVLTDLIQICFAFNVRYFKYILHSGEEIVTVINIAILIIVILIIVIIILIFYLLLLLLLLSLSSLLLSLLSLFLYKGFTCICCTIVFRRFWTSVEDSERLRASSCSSCFWKASMQARTFRLSLPKASLCNSEGRYPYKNQESFRKIALEIQHSDTTFITLSELHRHHCSISGQSHLWSTSQDLLSEYKQEQPYPRSDALRRSDLSFWMLLAPEI